MSLIALDLLNNRPLIGQGIGRSCSDTAKFKEGAPAFTVAANPYNAEYKPMSPTNFDTFDNLKTNPLTFELIFDHLDDTVSLECWAITLTLGRSVSFAPEDASGELVP